MRTSFLALILISIVTHSQPSVGWNFIGKKTIDIAYFLSKTFLGEEICHECLGKLIPNRSYRPYANGCGSYGIHIDFNNTVYSGFDACCNEHDMCYQLCDKNKDDCDDNFIICMGEFCQRFSANSTIYSGCQETVLVAHRMVRAFGCSTYKQSKKMACECVLNM